MTAEIAILNKSAVALAADSAVTLSAGKKEEKIFDSADKLFELSHHNPIGIMIYNGMSFAETPLQSLIKQFRDECDAHETVDAAAKAFLEFLNVFGKSSPQSVIDDNLRRISAFLVQQIVERVQKKFEDFIFSRKKPGDLKTEYTNILSEAISLYERIVKNIDKASFVGGKSVRFTSHENTLIERIIKDNIKVATDEQVGRIVVVIKKLLQSRWLSPGRTGIVIAGFGSGEIFPTLVSYEIDGMICRKLKHIQTNRVDIDRGGARAGVIPFAQKEMVERFLYGLDDTIEKDVTEFCKATVPSIRRQIVASIDIDDEEARKTLEREAEAAEEAFLQGLREKAFAEIRKASQAEIEDMVEFMPKPELAKMAEALVNLTSIKRRVSRGMETVGGPIDVALISQSEGFVWVKRKHYFPAELNSRYFDRVRKRYMGGSDG